jgi:SAM-dependent methyltransferase
MSQGGQGAPATDVLEQALGSLPGGRILDVATGYGGFVGVLEAYLPAYTHLVGVDIWADAVQNARREFSRPGVHFLQMDAARLGFGAASFDAVSISYSIHHLPDVPGVLAQMMRVLKPHGHLVLVEMVQDAQTEAQQSAVSIHHWAAEVDLALGFPHYNTFARQELVDLAGALDLHDLAFYDRKDLAYHDAGSAVRGLEGVIERYLQRAAGLPGYAALEGRAEELRRRLHSVGVEHEAVLVGIGRK